MTSFIRASDARRLRELARQPPTPGASVTVLYDPTALRERLDADAERIRRQIADMASRGRLGPLLRR